jgi:hypothetical protein
LLIALQRVAGLTRRLVRRVQSSIGRLHLICRAAERAETGNLIETGRLHPALHEHIDAALDHALANGLAHGGEGVALAVQGPDDTRGKAARHAGRKVLLHLADLVIHRADAIRPTGKARRLRFVGV